MARLLPTVLAGRPASAPGPRPGAAPGRTRTLVLDLDEDLLAFQGHFPGDPILPGVVQVDWAIRFGGQAFGPLGRFRGLDQVKFMGLMRPGERVELQLAWASGPHPDPSVPADRLLKFHYRVAGELRSSGAVRFAADDLRPEA